MRAAGWVAGLAIAMTMTQFSPATAAEEAPTPPVTATADTVTLPDGSTVDPSTLTEEDWQTAVDQLVSSDLQRTVTESAAETTYVFDVPVDGSSTFQLTVSVPKEGPLRPRLGGGTDDRGLYILLNNFDQNMVVGGGAAAVSAALCAIPAVGWVGCAAITVAVVAANVWISQNGLCPQNLKMYIVSGPTSPPRCVKY